MEKKKDAEQDRQRERWGWVGEKEKERQIQGLFQDILVILKEPLHEVKFVCIKNINMSTWTNLEELYLTCSYLTRNRK